MEPSKYQEVVVESYGATEEVMPVRLRYKHSGGNHSIKIHVPAEESTGSEDFQFAASIAGFGMLLRGFEYSRNVSFELAHNGIGQSDDNYCQEFLRLTDTAQLLKALLVTGR